MTKHYTIELDDDELERARVGAEAQGIAMEDYLKGLIAAHLPVEGSASRQRIS